MRGNPTMKKRLIRTLIVIGAVLPFAAPALDLNKIKIDKLKSAAEKVKQLKPMNEQNEIALGRDVAANLVGAAPLVNDPALQDYINKLGRWIALHSDRPGLPWRFGVLDTPGINAFATPGGYVFVTRGMLARCHDEAELAGVLAHEISHVTERHALNTMRKGALAGLAGDALNEYAAQRGKENYAKLISASTEIYSRGLDKEDEFAADRLGVVLAARAGYDPYGLPSVLQTLASINPADGAVALLFKTHPDPSKRLDLLIGSMEGSIDPTGSGLRVADRFVKVAKPHIQ
jgi:predicted Zn-dependent protease